MQHFQDTNETIRIINGEQEFTCSSAEFAQYEPDYQLLSLPFRGRVWTPDVQYLSKGNHQETDPFYTSNRFALYSGKIGDYKQQHEQWYAYIDSGEITAICSHTTGWQDAEQHLALSQAEYDSLSPVLHEAGISRWIQDDISPTITIGGVGFREKNQTELDADSTYQTWQAEQTKAQTQTQAQTDFTKMTDWIKTATTADVDTYVETTATTLAGTRTVLKQVIKLLLMLRDYDRIEG